MSYFDDQTPVGRMNPVSVSGSKIGTPASVSGLSVAHKQIGPVIETTLTLTNVAQSVVEPTQYVGTLLYTFPKGSYSIIGANGTLTQKTTSNVTSTIVASKTGDVGVGTATASSTTLASTMQDILPKTSFTTSTVINEAGTAVVPTPIDTIGATVAVVDGNSTADEVYLNCGYDDAGEVLATGTQTWTGTIEITWIYWKGTVSAVD